MDEERVREVAECELRDVQVWPILECDTYEDGDVNKCPKGDGP